VVAVTQLQDLSFATIVEGFGHLPATTQAALVMALLSAYIIPRGALVAGDGWAALALERRTGNDFREERWQEVEFTVIYRAVFVRYLQQGIAERDARQRSYSEVKGYLGRGNPSGAWLLSAPNGQSGHLGNGQSEQVGKVKANVRAHLGANPDLYQLSINQVLSALKSAGAQAGRTTVADVLRERKRGE
jgi:hypothetical protein